VDNKTLAGIEKGGTALYPVLLLVHQSSTMNRNTWAWASNSYSKKNVLEMNNSVSSISSESLKLK